MKTYSPKAGEVKQTWHLLDAENVPLGRLASQAAALLRGKHRPSFTPHMDMGDFVVVVNAGRVRLSSSEDDKKYYRHSGYIGGLRTRTFREMREKFPTRTIEIAVKGMLPHNRLGARLLTHLKVYAGPAHPHEAQLRAGTGARARSRAEAAAAAASTKPALPAKPEPASGPRTRAAAAKKAAEQVAVAAEAAAKEMPQAEAAPAAVAEKPKRRTTRSTAAPKATSGKTTAGEPKAPRRRSRPKAETSETPPKGEEGAE